MFRTIVILGILAACAFMAGWFTIDRDDKETTIRFNRDEIRADTSKAIAKGREILNADRGMEGQSAPDASVPFEIPQFAAPDATQNDFNQATRPIPPWEQPATTNPAGGPIQY